MATILLNTRGDFMGPLLPRVARVAVLAFLAACQPRDASDTRATRSGAPYDILIRGGTVVDGTGAFFPASLVRQAMLNIMIVLSKTFPDGSIRVTYSLLPSEITICIECSTLQSTRVPEWDQVILFQQYEDAVSLLGICDGQLTVSPLSENSGCCTKIRIPLQRQLPVLVIDDNSDSLVLMERYLAGSPYL